jgi:hypothetical protein
VHRLRRLTDWRSGRGNVVIDTVVDQVEFFGRRATGHARPLLSGHR